MDKPWLIYIDGQEKYLDNISYLNLLLERSREAISKFNPNQMIFIKFDLEEIKEQNGLLYSLYKLVIDSEISTLNRLTKNSVLPYDIYCLRKPKIINLNRASSSRQQ